MTYKVYKFERPTIDSERRVSFTRGALVKTNDLSWIAKFGRTVSETVVSDEASVLTIDAPEKEVEQKIAKKSLRKARKPSVPKKKALPFGKTTAIDSVDNTAVLGKDVDTKNSVDSE